MKYGVSEEDARYYDRRIFGGGIWVDVETRDHGADQLEVRRILDRAGGERADNRHASTVAY